jgi:Domain of unknown function (DUF4404)
MSDQQQRLKATLDDLHQQLAGVEQLDPAQQAQLSATLQEIQTALAGKKSASSESVMRRLGEMAREFEDSHPALATTIGGLINTLANSGI